MELCAPAKRCGRTAERRMDHYEIIGSGPGGASLAHRLAPTGKRILLLERGDDLPRSQKNRDSQTVFDPFASSHPYTQVPP
jgi:choline dehydrogenase-like flavoprotein